MGTTRDTLLADAGAVFTTVVLIEGYQNALTDGSPAAVAAALAGSSIAAHVAYERVVGGLSVKWDVDQRSRPWRGLDDDPPHCSFTVVPGPYFEGSAVADPVDDVGRDVWKRSGGAETAVEPGGTLAPTRVQVKARSTAAFGNSGVIYIGPEAIGYDTKGATEFTDLTNAKWTPFETSGGDRFARTHVSVDLATVTGDPIGVRAPTLIADEPRRWIGRWVAIYLLCDRGGTLDVTSEGLRAFAGMIRNVGQDGNSTVIECEEVRRIIYETQVLRSQFRAALQEGIALVAGQYFQVRTVRSIGGTATVGDGNVLAVVASGASGSNQLDAGIYTVHEIATAITAWLQGELTSGRILFSVRYDAAFSAAAGLRGRLYHEDPISVADNRRTVVTFPDAIVGKFLGWTGDRAVIDDPSRSESSLSPNPPLRVSLFATGATATRALVNPTGTWAAQNETLPAVLRDPAGLFEGVLKVGDFGFAVVRRITDTSFEFSYLDVSAYFPSKLRDTAFITVEDQGALTVSQVLVMEGRFSTLVRRLLQSTGTTNYNSPHDQLGATIGCGIPYSIFGDEFDDEIENLPEADRTLCAIVDKPTRFVDLMNADFVLRWAFFVWQAGRLSVRSWSTPTATARGVVAVGEAERAVPLEQARSGPQRSTSLERFEDLQNVVRVDYGRSAAGELVSEVTFADDDSIGAHGHRGYRIEARNTAGQASMGDIRGLLASFSTAMPMFSRPAQVVRRALGREMFDQLVPGTPVLLTDRTIRNPETGLAWSHVTSSGGLNGWPAIVLASRYDWGGTVAGIDGRPTVRAAGGEVQLLVFERVIGAPYSPCAEVDDTVSSGGFSAGYNAGTKTLRCKANAHSLTGHDAAEFGAGALVRVIEIDPATAASPLTWTDEVASQSGDDLVLVTGLAGWDNTKFYRVISDSYSVADATQQTDTYQADDGDGLVEDLRQPYGLVHTGAGQGNVTRFTDASSTEVPALYATAAVGDGAPLDTGGARDLARLLNNLVDYKTAGQYPLVTSEDWTYGGGGTWNLVACMPLFVGIGLLAADETILLYVAPHWKSTDGTSTQVRYTLSRVCPGMSTRDDVTFAEPYVQTTFTTTSTTYATPTPATLDTRHVARGPGTLGGVGWLSVEIKNKASLRGMAGHLRVGPRSAP